MSASSQEAAAVGSSAGEAMFARYAFPPNELGHCGPPGADVLLAGGARESVGDELRQRVPQFDGAWPYLQLLAAAAGADDALDAEVVAAYWLGGDLLDRVSSPDLAAGVAAAFGGQPGVPERLAALPAGGAVASHAFHVFVVYPWVGLLGSGSDVPRQVLDSCRVRWGTVESVEGERAVVRSQPLTWDGIVLDLGAERPEICRWASGERSFVSGLQAGDRVSLHWDWVCDRLDGHQMEELAGRSRHQLDVTNRWLAGR